MDKTPQQQDDEHWDAAQNSRDCYEVAIVELRKRFLEGEEDGAADKAFRAMVDGVGA